MSHPHTSAARLHRAIRGIVDTHAPDRQWLAIGMIQADGSLLVDGDPTGYPLGTYWRLRALDVLPAMVDADSPTLVTSSALGGAEAHTHAFALPTALAPLTAGDAVLVAWMQQQQTPVVLGVLRKAV